MKTLGKSHCEAILIYSSYIFAWLLSHHQEHALWFGRVKFGARMAHAFKCLFKQIRLLNDVWLYDRILRIWHRREL